MYKEKYLKYKTKYLDLKNQLDSYPNIIQDGGMQVDTPQMQVDTTQMQVAIPNNMTEFLSSINSNEKISKWIKEEITKEGQIMGIENNNINIFIHVKPGYSLFIDKDTDLYTIFLDIYNKYPKSMINRYRRPPNLDVDVDETDDQGYTTHDTDLRTINKLT